jgi:ABC-type polysaccharide/polyol phosphate export permease
MRKRSRHVVRVLLVTLAVAFVVLMVLGFAIGYTIAPHDKLVLGSIRALAGAAVLMVGCWVLVAVLAARWRDSPEEISL